MTDYCRQPQSFTSDYIFEVVEKAKTNNFPDKALIQNTEEIA